MNAIQAIFPGGFLPFEGGSAGVDTTSSATFQRFLSQKLTAPEDASYVVKNGDNLTRIVQRYLDQRQQAYSPTDLVNAVQKVAAANGLSNPNLILPGQKMTLGALDSKAAALPSTPLVIPEEPAPVSAPTLPVREDTSAPLSPTDPRLRTYQAVAVTEEAPLTGQGGGPADSIPLTSAADRLLPTLVTGTESTVRSVMGMVRKVRALLTTSTSSVKAAEKENIITSPWAKLVEEPVQLTSEYGMRADPFTGRPAFHHGIDLAANKGSAIHAMDAGTVIASGWELGYGKVVHVQHADGLETVYGHCDELRVKPGDRITKDTIIATVGSTGRSTSDQDRKSVV